MSDENRLNFDFTSSFTVGSERERKNYVTLGDNPTGTLNISCQEWEEVSDGPTAENTTSSLPGDELGERATGIIEEPVQSHADAVTPPFTAKELAKQNANHIKTDVSTSTFECEEPFFKPIEQQDVTGVSQPELFSENDSSGKVFSADDTANDSIFIEKERESIETIEGVSYYRKEPGRPKKNFIEPPALYDGIYYGTESVARMLGITSQTVRSYCDDFPEFITISKKEKGQRVLSVENIEQLRHILKIKDTKNLTKTGLKEYLKNPDNFNAKGASQDFETLKTMLSEFLTVSNERINERVNSALLELTTLSKNALEDTHAGWRKQVNEQQQVIDTQQKQIDALMSALKESISSANKQAEISQNTSIQRIKELEEKCDMQSKTIEKLENEKSQKKKFFGLFG